MQTKPILVVMAAGDGQPLRRTEADRPGGAVRRGYPRLQSLYDARRAGFETVVFIIKHLRIEGDAFKEAVGARALRAGFEVRYAFTSSLAKAAGGFSPCRRAASSRGGTAHAILVAEEAIRQRAVCGHQRGMTATTRRASSWCILPEHPRG